MVRFCEGVAHLTAILSQSHSLHPLYRIGSCQREFFIDNLLIRIHVIIVTIRLTGLAPWEFEFPFPGCLASTLN